MGHTNTVQSVAVTPDGDRFVTASGDNTVRIWNAKTFVELGTLKGHSGWVHSLAVMPDGARIAAVSEDRTARVWDAKSFLITHEPQS